MVKGRVGWAGIGKLCAAFGIPVFETTAKMPAPVVVLVLLVGAVAAVVPVRGEMIARLLMSCILYETNTDPPGRMIDYSGAQVQDRACTPKIQLQYLLSLDSPTL